MTNNDLVVDGELLSPIRRDEAERFDKRIRSTYDRSSQQVSWSDVHAFVLPRLQKVGDWPMVGSPDWCLLDDGDRVKWASVLDAGQHWALRVEYLQQVECEASDEISAAVDWATQARIIKKRTDYFAARPWLNRRDGR